MVHILVWLAIVAVGALAFIAGLFWLIILFAGMGDK